MDANDDKINAVVQFGQRLQEEGNFASDKIQQKTDSLQERLIAIMIILFLLRLIFWWDNILLII